MNQLEFNKIITEENLKKYKNLSKNICRQTYKIEIGKKNYILKINSSKTLEEFELIVKTIQTLNENKFSTPKLIISKYEHNISYFLFEYVEESIDKEIKGLRDKDIETILKLVKEFYKLTSKIANENKENQIILYVEKNIEKFSFIHKNLLHNIINELKETTSKCRLIVTDINKTNFLNSKKTLNMIDFDEVCFSEIEYDISQIFLNFILNEKPKNSLEQNIKELKKIIKEFEKITVINPLKIINYLIIAMYHDIIKFEHEKRIQEEIFKKILFILNNKKLILSLL